MGKQAIKVASVDVDKLLGMLNEELEHENDIEDWLTDLQRMKDEFRKLRM